MLIEFYTKEYSSWSSAANMKTPTYTIHELSEFGNENPGSLKKILTNSALSQKTNKKCGY